MTATQVNVRAAPSSAGAQLGMLAPFVKVKISGRDPSGNWYEVQYAQGADGKGWVASQYISVQTGKDSIPVIGGATATTAPTDASGTPAAGTTAGSAATGTVIQQLNVRKGPGTSFDPLGTLNPKDTVTLIGRDASGSWLQIQYPAAPDGKGWVAASFVQAPDAQSLPIVGEASAPAATDAPSNTQPVITATPAAALLDNDSAEAPAANVTFSPTGTRSLIYTSDVSAPEGDSRDWVEFTAYGTSMLLSLECTGNGALKVALAANGSPLTNWIGIACGETKPLMVSPGSAYLAEISIAPNGDARAYVRYTLRIEATG